MVNSKVLLFFKFLEVIGVKEIRIFGYRFKGFFYEIFCIIGEVNFK